MMSTVPVSLQVVQPIRSEHVPLYKWHAPVYQTVLLSGLQSLWDESHRVVLDVGGGTGIIAHAAKKLFGLDRIVAVDVENRFLPSLDVETSVYDGQTLPFENASFDALLLTNVLHHVPLAGRIRLLQECRRVVGAGPIYIKDHLSTGLVDGARLAVLDLLGNMPFSGMVSAQYLDAAAWSDLMQRTQHRCPTSISGEYRGGVMAGVFPNRLETIMKWLPA